MSSRKTSDPQHFEIALEVAVGVTGTRHRERTNTFFTM